MYMYSMNVCVVVVLGLTCRCGGVIRKNEGRGRSG